MTEYLSEEPGNILKLPASNSIQSSLNGLLQSEQLIDENRYFCHICSSLQPAEVKYNLLSVGNYLIIQIKRFTFQLNISSKDITLIKCSEPLSVPISNEHEVSVNKQYQLSAVINHSGTLNSGHYWSLVKHNNKWVHCNDKAVIPCSPASVDCKNSYVFLYKAV